MIVPKIKELVTKRFGLKPIDLRQRSRKRPIALSRQIIIYFLKKSVGMNDYAVAATLKVDRSYAVHAYRKIESWRETDWETRTMIEGIEDEYPVLRGERDLV